MRAHSRNSIVIVGAGFGGLEAAKALAGADVALTLVDRKNHHCFQPLLYQVATASLSPADIAWPIRSILASQANTTVIMADVAGVDAASKKVLTADGGAIPYDSLILATGATYSYFAHPEWASFAPGLKTIEDATQIRARILGSFEKAERADSAEERARFMTFIVIGGGPTGVELAGSIADIAHNVLANDFRRIKPKQARIMILEGGTRMLSALPEELSRYARDALVAMGIDVRTSSLVTQCDERGVVTATGERIESDCVLWAAGVRASPAASWLGLAGDRAGRIEVDQFLSVPGMDGVFAIGDTAHVQSNGGAVPGLAPAAKQMGRYVGKYIAAELNGRKNTEPFRYQHQGDLATIGRKSAVVSLHKLKLTGFVGWIFWSVAHVFFLIGARNRIVVATNWLWEYLTFQRGARLISK
jgi:NADH dehydrogenase